MTLTTTAKPTTTAHVPSAEAAVPAAPGAPVAASTPTGALGTAKGSLVSTDGLDGQGVSVPDGATAREVLNAALTQGGGLVAARADVAKLAVTAGAIHGPIGDFGDVEFDIKDGVLPTLLPNAELSAAFNTALGTAEGALFDTGLKVLGCHVEGLAYRQNLDLSSWKPVVPAGSWPAFQSGVTGLSSQIQAGLQNGGGANTTSAAWSNFSNTAKLHQLPVDINAVVQFVIRQSYLEQCKDLEDYANKVKYFNEVKQQIREELKLVRDAMAKVAGGDDTTPLDPPMTKKSFDTTYAGSPEPGGAIDSLPEPERSEAIRKQELAAEVPGAIEAYEAELATHTIDDTVTVPGGPAFEAQESKSGVGTSYGNNLAAWYRGLTEEQQAAVRADLEKNGIKFNGWASEYDDMSENESKNFSSTMGPLEPGADDAAVEAYLKAAASEYANSLPDSVDDSAAYKWGISASVGGEVTVQVPDPNADVPLPDVLVEAGYDPETGECSELEGYQQPAGLVATKADADAYMKELEDLMNTVGEDAQLANVDLQNCLQKQQQSMQMMSNMSKQLHDTQLNTIRKIGG